MDRSSTHSASSGQDGRFLSGFLLGLLIGGFVVFLLGTKKGKKLLKAISEDGIENFSNILDETNNSLDPDEDVVKPKIIASKPGVQRKAFVRRREFAIIEKPIIEKPKVRRFFRGISRRVN